MSAAETPDQYHVLPLRPYQQEAADAVISSYRRGLRRLLVQMATGLGKTILFAALAHAVVRRGRRVLVIAHREELLTQARDKLVAADPRADVGIVRAELDEAGAQIVVASVQTLARPDRLARLGRFASCRLTPHPMVGWPYRWSPRPCQRRHRTGCVVYDSSGLTTPS